MVSMTLLGVTPFNIIVSEFVWCALVYDRGSIITVSMVMGDSNHGYNNA